MRTKLSLAVLMLLLITGLVWINSPHTAIAPTPANPSSQAVLPKLPAHFVGTAHPEPAAGPRSAEHFREWLKEDLQHVPKLTPEQLEGYLRANHRNAESLLGALYTSGDHAFLREAMTNFPNDPKVAYAALYFGNLSPEDARQWADNFKRADPNNSMADYASALNYMKSGQPNLALQDMTAAASANWSDFSSQFVQNSEEAYRSAGYSDVDAKIAAQSQLLLPDLAQLKQLGQQLATLANSQQQSGDSASAQTTLQMDMQLGRQLSASQAQPLITTLVGYAIENIALSGMDPNAPYGSPGQTAQDQINQIQQQRDYLRSMTSQTENLVSIMSDDDFLTFLERRQSSGEINALQWATAKYTPQ
jgi:hypothetical protein